MRTLCATILAAIVTHCKSVVIAATCGVAAVADTVWIEAESFEDCGGWVNDTQFMDQMGSPYLLAHGLGKSVSDAKTKFVAKGGRYNVWVRTKNWTSFWHPDIGAGTFNLVINGEKLPNLLGCQGKGEWLWVKADDVTLKDGENTLALHDRDGFDGRVDAIVFTTEANPLAFLDNPRRPSCVPAIKNLNIPRYDVVVVGGGVAGICAAISSARLGLRTALVHDRPILGGNNSSEVRVHLGAYANIPPYPRLGDVLAEFGPRRIGNAEPASNYEDDLKMKVVKQTKGLDLYLNQHVNGVVTNCEGRITAVTAQDTRKGGLQNFEGSWFVDCTGDGNLGFLAGADYRMGREAKVETNEPDAPEKADMVTMGASVQWYAGSRGTDNGERIPRAKRVAEGDALAGVGMGNGNDFPVRPWMLKTINEGNCSPHLKGDWWWEAGLGRDQIKEGEYIRDYGFLVAFSNWAFVKNCYSKKDLFAEKELKWVAYNAGRRESRRLLGDFILDQNHLRSKDFQPDGTCATTWTIDLHLPKTAAESKFDGEPYQSNSLNERIWPYPIPYRCLYSRNVPNLFMAGRDISVTHIALGTTRLMRTHGMMGEVVGMAAAVCKKHGCDPREVYTKHFGELKALMEKGVGDGNKHPRQDYNCQSSLDPDIRKKHAESVKGRVAFEQETKKECFSGIYPHLAMFNDEGECGVGAVVPWAGDLWVVTYGPHCPLGSSDKLYRIKPDLTRETFPGSVGGTPANRMIHRETNQLLIGPYVIDAKGNVRVIPPERMPGRLTGAARHLSDPNKVYVATMETGLFELDMRTLDVDTLIRENGKNDMAIAAFLKKSGAPWPVGWEFAPVTRVPGYHAKGLASGFGKVFVSNNGEDSPEARRNPFVPSGVLAWWNELGRDWTMIRRCQFTEIATPDGIYGNEHPSSNPVWAMGWDAKSVILGVTTNGSEWAYYRLPKASNAYDGAHGWNTEWPRIRDVGFGDGTLLATMHGTFWRFPRTFSPANPNGIRPISTYLKVIGDFCRWGDRIVFGCDDQTKSEFLGKRGLKKDAPRCERSQSNLWFVKPEELSSFGPPSGEGCVWLDEDVKAGDVSDPYLYAGYDSMRFSFVRADGSPVKHELMRDGDWVRVKCLEDANGVTARFSYGPKECTLPALSSKESISVKDDNGNVWRFPNVNGDTNVVCREIVTERDLLYVGGVWYEVPADNAGGFAALRPIALADEPVKSLYGKRGLMYLNGKPMVIDDLWKNGTSAAAYWLWNQFKGNP